ncbi:hypothetical protein I7I50_10094 [Histoplasma capsulatum G186AR]|uniref:Uncharacterized protein n=1 Tax=Ajellomyces capsulatus TaxID=5037 RepID=A0A8H7Z3U2_AJECA|nr:hypothetical protein I7I52_01332 [Histoplasma capsulatum]QSS68950.1 hypothetical protein I7I50_10094 [Histoplasma capsulatum G186AR]
MLILQKIPRSPSESDVPFWRRDSRLKLLQLLRRAHDIETDIMLNSYRATLEDAILTSTHACRMDDKNDNITL